MCPQIHENVAGSFILFWRHHSQHLGHGSWWIMAVIAIAAGCLHVHCLPQLLLRGELHLSNVHLLLRWVHWDGKTHSIVKMHKESKGAWHSITNHDISSFLWNHTSSTHESPLILRAVEKPTLSWTTECWLGGWMAECLLPSLRQDLLPFPASFSLISTKCWLGSRTSVSSLYLVDTTLPWVAKIPVEASVRCGESWRKTPDLWQVRNCCKFGLQTCATQSLESIQMS